MLQPEDRKGMVMTDHCERDNGRPKVLIFLKVFLPGSKSGGPIRSVQAMTEILGEEFEFSVVALDRDSGDSAPYPGSVPLKWLENTSYRIMYVPNSLAKCWHIWRVSRKTSADVLYLQSFLNPVFTWIPLLAYRLGLSKARRCLVAPRGEFYPGALAIRSLRKRVFISAANQIGLFRYCDWHASTIEESKQIEKQMGISVDSNCERVFVASDLVPVSGSNSPSLQYNEPERAADGAMRVVFLSRLVPKKNLDFAIESLMHCRERVQFSIFGPADQDSEYWSHCESLLKHLPENVKSDYFGVASPHEVRSIFGRHDLFLFPSRGENFGHVIAESLLSGCPVLISDRTPWRELEDEGVGWDLPLDDPKRFSQIVDQAARMSTQDRQEQRQRAREFASVKVNSAHEVNQNRQMLQSIAKRDS